MIQINPKQKMKWYEFRYQLAALLVKLAKRVYPESSDVKAFYMKMIHDLAISGKHVIRINHKDHLDLAKKN